MRFIIYGAGGIGGVIGAQLFMAGHEVALIARGAHLKAMQDHGMRYETPNLSEILHIPAFSHPREIDWREDDVVLLTMKSQHTSDALEQLRIISGDEIPVICCQNGVANERMALRVFQNVYAMLVYLPAALLEPGLVQTHAIRKIGVLDAGVYPNGTDPMITRVTAALAGANFSAEPCDKVMRFKYGKLMMNLGNSLQAIAIPGEGAKEISRQMRREALACFAAAGIDCVSQAEEKQRRGDLMQTGEIKGSPRVAGSSWQSLQRGTGDIEADFLNGEIVLLGRMHGVATPANLILQRLATKIARERGGAQSMEISEIQKLIAAQ